MPRFPSPSPQVACSIFLFLLMQWQKSSVKIAAWERRWIPCKVDCEAAGTGVDHHSPANHLGKSEHNHSSNRDVLVIEIQLQGVHSLMANKNDDSWGCHICSLLRLAMMQVTTLAAHFLQDTVRTTRPARPTSSYRSQASCNNFLCCNVWDWLTTMIAPKLARV